jgi:hypothetical protein
MFTDFEQAFYSGFSSATHLTFPEEEELPPSLISRRQSKYDQDDELMEKCN